MLELGLGGESKSPSLPHALLACTFQTPSWLTPWTFPHFVLSSDAVDILAVLLWGTPVHLCRPHIPGEVILPHEEW